MKRIVIVLLVVVAIVGAVVTRRGGTPGRGSRPSAAVEQATYYCPMHPTYTSDRPGVCAICGMSLVKRDAAPPVTRETEMPAGPAGYVPVQLSSDQQAMMGLTTAVVERRAMSRTIRAAGRIAYDPELYQAQQEYLQALAARARAQEAATPEVLERARQLVQAVELRLRLLGVSPEWQQELAQQDAPDESFLVPQAAGRAWLYATIYEVELPWVTPGQRITARVPGTPGTTLEGVIRAVDPVLDPSTRTARVRALITDPTGTLRPEMFVDVRLEIPAGEVVTVPESAVFHTGTRQIAFVAQEDGRFEPREVIVGTTAEGFSEIRDGVTEGERVVTGGNFLLDSESRLKAALHSTPAGGGHQHGS